MNRAIAIAALASVLFIARPAAAQQSGWTDYSPSKTLFTMGYQISEPIGDLKSYTPGTSFRGVTFDWRSMLSKSFSLGLRFNWNRWNDNASQVQATVTPGGTPAGATPGTLSGPVFRYADQFALQAVSHFYFGDRESLFIPFAGVGLGGVWSNSYQQTIDLGFSQNGFYFITTPELGLLWNFSRGRTSAALHASVLYNFTTASFRNVSNAQALVETMGLTVSY
jgi:hypothetical protein